MAASTTTLNLDRVLIPPELFERVEGLDIKDYTCAVCLEVPLKPRIKCTLTSCTHVLCKGCFVRCCGDDEKNVCFPCPVCCDTTTMTEWSVSAERMRVIAAWPVGCKQCWLRFSALEYARHECVVAGSCPDCLEPLGGGTLAAHRTATCPETVIVCAGCGRRHKRGDKAAHGGSSGRPQFGVQGPAVFDILDNFVRFAAGLGRARMVAAAREGQGVVVALEQEAAASSDDEVPQIGRRIDRLVLNRIKTTNLRADSVHEFAWVEHDLVALTFGGGLVEMQTLAGAAQVRPVPIAEVGAIAALSPDGCKIAVMRANGETASVTVHERTHTFHNLPPVIGDAVRTEQLPARRARAIVWIDAGSRWAIVDGSRLFTSTREVWEYGSRDIRKVVFRGAGGSGDWHVVVRADGAVLVADGRGAVSECRRIPVADIDGALILWNAHVSEPVFALITDAIRVCATGVWTEMLEISPLMGYQTAAWLDRSLLMTIAHRPSCGVFIHEFVQAAPLRRVSALGPAFRVGIMRQILSPDGSHMALYDKRRDRVTLASVVLPAAVERLRGRAAPALDAQQ